MIDPKAQPEEHGCIRFVPSRVTGADGITDVVVWPDRLELIGQKGSTMVWFSQIARWPRPAWLWGLLSCFGIRPKWLPIADRDWFHAPRDRFFAFYASPPIVIYMPAEDRETPYAETVFRKIQDVAQIGGFSTFDLG